MIDARFDVDMVRFGALGIEEISRSMHDLERPELDAFLDRQLSTMTPLDSMRLEIRRRGGNG